MACDRVRAWQGWQGTKTAHSLSRSGHCRHAVRPQGSALLAPSAASSCGRRKHAWSALTAFVRPRVTRATLPCGRPTPPARAGAAPRPPWASARPARAARARAARSCCSLAPPPPPTREGLFQSAVLGSSRATLAQGQGTHAATSCEFFFKVLKFFSRFFLPRFE